MDTFEQLHPREAAGRFTNKVNSPPEQTLVAEPEKNTMTKILSELHLQSRLRVAAASRRHADDSASMLGMAAKALRPDARTVQISFDDIGCRSKVVSINNEALADHESEALQDFVVDFDNFEDLNRVATYHGLEVLEEDNYPFELTLDVGEVHRSDVTLLEHQTAMMESDPVRIGIATRAHLAALASERNSAVKTIRVADMQTVPGYDDIDTSCFAVISLEDSSNNVVHDQELRHELDNFTLSLDRDVSAMRKDQSVEGYDTYLIDVENASGAPWKESV
ncbi:hypothetical protein [Lysinibacter cavernae]|uniref:hypothetical protein n=1 Tax=Lysinibacter cavernae TaxID=1640652 RepID=UPI00360C949E